MKGVMCTQLYIWCTVPFFLIETSLFTVRHFKSTKVYIVGINFNKCIEEVKSMDEQMLNNLKLLLCI